MYYFVSYIHNIVTSDVQRVSANITGESTIRIQCLFIRGSDAIGCKVVLVSDCSNYRDMHTNITKRETDTKASEQLNLRQNVFCYHKVIAYDIDVNNTIRDLGIEGLIQPLTSDANSGYL